MAQYKKKNIALGAFGRLLFNEGLWTKRFALSWAGCLLTVLVFDLLWCGQTTFRALGFVSTYINALTLATVMALPSVATRKQWPQIALMAVVDLLMIANLMYCRTYFNSIPPASYLLVGQVFDFHTSIADSWSWRYLSLPLVTLLTLLFTFTGKEVRKPVWTPYLITLVLLGSCSVLAAVVNGGLVSHVEWLKSECYYATTPPVIYTPFGTLAAELAITERAITPEEREGVAQWNRDHMRFQSRMQQTSRTIPDSLRRDNLIVIICESLESWPIGARLEGKELTPHLNAAMADTASTWYASQVLSQVGNGRSIDGQLLMLAGMYPMRNDVFSMKYPEAKFFALPDAMKEQGAKTYLLSGDKPSTWNQGLVARSFGITRQEMADSWDNSERIGHPKRLSDGSLIEQTIAKMQRGDVWPEGEKAYVQLVTYTGHNPFKIPEKLRTITFSGDHHGKLIDYLTAVNYTDQALGHFIDYLKSRPDWDRTMVVVAGDHEALASWRHEIRNSAEGRELVAPAGFVPMIVLNSPVGGTHNEVMGQVDVYTTLLDLMGLPYSWRGMGFSALSPDSPRFAYDYQGTMEGTAAGAAAGLREHVASAPQNSDLMIRHQLIN
ncbi:MAG: LTA synthase family protein [Bacteroidales bacterium]|nr:LTA synthase family protein [Bacteroidales bacterium]